MLIIAYEIARRVGGKGCLACAGKSKEQRRIAVVADVCRAMHRENVLVGQYVVHYGEYALLDFTCVLASCDEHSAFFKVDDYCSLRMYTVYAWNALKARRRDYRETGCETLELILRRPYEKLMNKEVLARKLIYDPNGQAVLFVCAGKSVENEYLTALQIARHLVVDVICLLARYRYIYLAPVDLVMNVGCIDYKSVLR